MPTSSPDDDPSRPPARRTGVGWLNIAADSRRAAPGLEWQIWRKLPWLALAGTAIPLLALGLVHLTLGGDQAGPARLRLLQLIDYITLGLMAFHWTLLTTVAIGCVIVMIMKGPHYTADSYRVPHRDRPGT